MNAEEYYDLQYRDGRYNDLYGAAEPSHVAPMARYCQGLIALILDLGPGARVLDLGSGAGITVRGWLDLGLEARGRELSREAIRLSGMPGLIDHGDALDLSSYADDSFDLVFSSQLLEHLTDEQIGRLMSQVFRVAKYSAHYIAHKVGDDPSHINIKPPAQWVELFGKHGKSFAFPNPLVVCAPMYIQLCNHVPPAFEHAYEHYFFDPEGGYV